MMYECSTARAAFMHHADKRALKHYAALKGLNNGIHEHFNSFLLPIVCIVFTLYFLILSFSFT